MSIATFPACYKPLGFCYYCYCLTPSSRSLLDNVFQLITFIKFFFLFSFFFFWPCHTACGILVPNQGLTPCSLQWKHGVLTTGLSGTVIKYFFQRFFFFFDVDHFSKVFIEFVIILLLFYVLVFWPPGMWDLVPWPGIEPVPTALEGEVPTTGPPGKSPSLNLNTTDILYICLYVVRCISVIFKITFN